MRLQYFEAAQGNFGDDLNRWIWSTFKPDLFDDDATRLFLGIGTIIGRPLPKEAREVIVFSSGLGYRPPPSQDGVRHHYVAVRGPLTARSLGLPETKAVGDGALLLARLAEFTPLPESSRSGTILVPHFEQMEDDAFLLAAENADIKVLDPRLDAKHVIHEIRKAEKVLADSMHAAIIADTLSVPWVPVASSRNISSFKWLDWAKSVGVPYEPTLLPSGSLIAAMKGRLKGYVEGCQFVGSSETAAVANYDRIAAARVRPDYEAKRYKALHRVDRLVGLARPTIRNSTIGQKLDRRQLERLTNSLARVKSKAGYLSQESKRREITDKLVYLLDSVAAEPDRVSSEWPKT